MACLAFQGDLLRWGVVASWGGDGAIEIWSGGGISDGEGHGLTIGYSRVGAIEWGRRKVRMTVDGGVGGNCGCGYTTGIDGKAL